MPPKPREAAKFSYLGLSNENVPEVSLIELTQLRSNPYQPRKTFDDEAIKELAQSIVAHGLIQPILVTPDKADRRVFYIVAGERRFRAYQLLGRTQIEAIVKDDVDLAEIALIENLQREDLSPIEEAEALAQLRERSNYSFAELAEKLAKPKATVVETVAIASLPTPILEAVRSEFRPVSKSFLIELTRLGSEEEQLTIWETVKDKPTLHAVRKQRSASSSGKPKLSIEKVLSEGERFARSLEQITVSDIQGEAHYTRLLSVLNSLTGAMGRLSQQAVEPRTNA